MKTEIHIDQWNGFENVLKEKDSRALPKKKKQMHFVKSKKPLKTQLNLKEPKLITKDPKKDPEGPRGTQRDPEGPRGT